jgi:predicted nuclease of restriction endonuclease-like (RecB) superfamily
MLPAIYSQTLTSLKDKIRQAQTRAVLTANVQLLTIYWEIGEFVVKLEKEHGWGSKIIDQLSADLKTEFPELKGLSSRNLRYMRAFYENWPELTTLQHSNVSEISDVILQQPVAKLPWGHICIINDRLKNTEERRFYALKTAENNWSRNVLLNQIDSGLFERQGKLQHNFDRTLSQPQGDLASELFKDPYKFDFFQLAENAKERDLENALINHLQKFLVELGKGFAFYGRQERLEKGGEEYILDLLFYHTKLHCYVVIELKIGEFKPEYAGKMNFYLSVVDDDYRMPGDNPSIGIILCKNKNKVTAEYALRDIHKPLGIAEYNLSDAIPQEIKGELPSIEDLENELEKSIEINQKPYELELNRLKSLISNLNREELKEKISDAFVFQLFTEVIPMVMQKAEPILESSIYPLFDNYLLNRNINNTSFEFYTSVDLESMQRQGTVSQLGIALRLNGFKKAGTKAFNIFYDLNFSMQDYYFTIGGRDENAWQTRLYHEQWMERDIDQLAEYMITKVLEEINKRIEVIT